MGLVVGCGTFLPSASRRSSWTKTVDCCSEPVLQSLCRGTAGDHRHPKARVSGEGGVFTGHRRHLGRHLVIARRLVCSARVAIVVSGSPSARQSIVVPGAWPVEVVPGPLTLIGRLALGLGGSMAPSNAGGALLAAGAHRSHGGCPVTSASTGGCYPDEYLGTTGNGIFDYRCPYNTDAFAPDCMQPQLTI